MASENVVHVGDNDFQKVVLESGEPVLVDFWATWCAPCRAIAPMLEELAAQYKGKIRIAKLNVDDHQNVPQRYDVRALPTLLLFKGGKVVEQVVGAVPKSKLEAVLQKA